MNKVVVVVGASRGIGSAIVAKFAKHKNTTVYALSRNVEKMNEQFLSFSNVNCCFFDLTKDIPKQLDLIFKDCSQIDFLINNAGYLVNKPFAQLSSADFLLSYQVNVLGVMQTVQSLLSKIHPSSHIVNISSMGGFQGTVKFAGLTAYSSSKAALVNFTEMFAEEFGKYGIKMNCLCLGAVQTEMFAEAFPNLKTYVTPEHIAEYIYRFTLDAHQWMNGKIVPVSLSTP